MITTGIREIIFHGIQKNSFFLSQNTSVRYTLHSKQTK